MNTTLSRSVLCVATLLVLSPVASAADADAEWISLFDGKTLEGWEKVGNEMSQWEVKDGAISGSGPASMLVCTTGPYKNFRYRAEIKINDGGNSGLYFRVLPRMELEFPGVELAYSTKGGFHVKNTQNFYRPAKGGHRAETPAG